MKKTNPQLAWQDYCESELAVATPILESLGFLLAKEQPHLGGERYLMQAVTTESGRKLILLGKRIKDRQSVVIKVSSDEAGQSEIRHERACREVLHQLNFAYNVFFSPREILYQEGRGLVISIQEFIEQDKTFLERPIAEQFSLALKSFKAQEGAHATTNKQRKLIASAFELRDAETYLKKFAEFQTKVSKLLPKNATLQQTLSGVKTELTTNQKTIDQYGDFLTHTDFVPHNIRVKHGKVYLLDHSSLTFGNKYEGWARFVNFMTLYHPPLAEATEQYVRDNRSEGEVAALRLMRLYRLGEIIYYYTDKLTLSEGNLLKLNQARIDFWHQILQHLLAKEPLPESIITDYRRLRDSLRSEDEKARQKGLH